MMFHGTGGSPLNSVLVQMGPGSGSGAGLGLGSFAAMSWSPCRCSRRTVGRAHMGSFLNWTFGAFSDPASGSICRTK